jgi:uncharacterized protein YejL (UPF0352 family)
LYSFSEEKSQDLSMPQQSKYSDESFENLMQDVIFALEKHDAGTDLSLMVLGNVVTNIFANQVAPQNRAAMIDKFCEILKRSTKGN